jgi:uncharacterized membrane protein YhiD involved in acid resistance
MEQTPWWLQVLANMFLSGIVAGIIVAWVKANMESYYQRKHREDLDHRSSKEKAEKAEKDHREREIAGLKNELLAVKGKMNQLYEKTSLISERVAVVISKQESQDQNLHDVQEMVKNMVQTYWGRVVKK